MDKDDLELFCFQLPENIEFCMLILTWKSLKRSTREWKLALKEMAFAHEEYFVEGEPTGT